MIILEFILAFITTCSLVLVFNYQSWQLQDQLNQKIQEHRRVIQQQIRELNQEGRDVSQ